MGPFCQEDAFFISNKRTGVLGGTYFLPVDGTGKTLDHLQQSPWPWEGWTSVYKFTIILRGNIPGALYSKDIVDPDLPPPTRRLILPAPQKSCELDLIPTSLFQKVIDDLLPFLTTRCSSSIREASLPDSQNRSVLLPGIK